jgi:glutaminyl-tRNA synthetase
LSAEQIRNTRGTLTEPGQNSPFRNRTTEENLDLFERMRSGEFADGHKVLRAKIDMTSPNVNMRDPVLYRISHTIHHNTGALWCIYPMYDYAHPLGDAIEGVTHSLCTLEFEDHRPLYDWVIRECEMAAEPKQYEFARLNLTNAVMSKRLLKQLVDEKVVDGWDDPRMPTISGLRRRGFTPESIRTFAKEIGISRSYSTVDDKMLEHFIREDLKLKVHRTMAVLEPLKVVITNYPEGEVELLEAENNQENPEMGSRHISFSREIYIEQDDFMENPPDKYHRLYPGNEVRLKNAYFIRCEEVIKDAAGRVVELRCTYDPLTKSGSGFTARKVKGTIHWVEATQAVAAQFRLYEPLLTDALGTEASFLDHLNPNSMQIIQGYVEVQMKEAKPNDKFQFFRHGYFNVDPKHTSPEQLVFNRIVSLKSSYEMPKEQSNIINPS